MPKLRSVTSATFSVLNGFEKLGQPADVHRFSSSPTNDVDVRHLAAWGTTPDELTIDLKGRRTPRLEACWDGCLFRL
jgi:hypothetical protein